ncbi:MAG TPA: hypothetical protein VMG98_07425 [Verrucomicrobiae bacterium]|nr:hypothetical protein [Verrucomicrobiae bacterium]
MRESLDHLPALERVALRTQLGAIVKNVSAYARSARQLGITDKAGLEESLDRLNAYLLAPDVYGVLKDFQAEALYDANVTLHAAFKTATAERDPNGATAKEAFGRACDALRKFWSSMGEVSST